MKSNERLDKLIKVIREHALMLKDDTTIEKNVKKLNWWCKD